MSNERFTAETEALIAKIQEDVSIEDEKAPGRSRSTTMLKLDWLAARARKGKKIKDAIEAGTYHIDTRRVAAAILNLDLKS